MCLFIFYKYYSKNFYKNQILTYPLLGKNIDIKSGVVAEDVGVEPTLLAFREPCFSIKLIPNKEQL